MFEEELVTCAQVIQSVLAIGSAEESMLGTFAVTRKAHVAFHAVARHRIVLVPAELLLLVGADQNAQRIFEDVAELVLRIDIVIARIEIAVVLDHRCIAARFAEDA